MREDSQSLTKKKSVEIRIISVIRVLLIEANIYRVVTVVLDFFKGSSVTL